MKLYLYISQAPSLMTVLSFADESEAEQALINDANYLFFRNSTISYMSRDECKYMLTTAQKEDGLCIDSDFDRDETVYLYLREIDAPIVGVDVINNAYDRGYQVAKDRVLLHMTLAALEAEGFRS